MKNYWNDAKTKLVQFILIKIIMHGYQWMQMLERCMKLLLKMKSKFIKNSRNHLKLIKKMLLHNKSTLN
ncbi:hypothetical protein ABD89_15785 [Lysinibacillus sphaericus]|nr:hypothetical protein [Lysinibacillus sphaericus]